jgi:LmbE family N-acetylglucosaminyl deacetylase
MRWSKKLYSFEILSSTEWNYPTTFSPNLFFDITETIEIKQKAMECYKLEMKSFTHPRSLEGIEYNAKSWGIKVGVKYAEAFRVVRILK